jgi:hypothetical protein
MGLLKRVDQPMRENGLRAEELRKGSDVLASLKEVEDLGKALVEPHLETPLSILHLEHCDERIL